MSSLKNATSGKQKNMAHKWHRKEDPSIWTGDEWTVQWLDDTTFKVEYEGMDLCNEDILNWIEAVDYQIMSYFGTSPPKLKMSMLNFSCNNITDEGIIGLVDFLCRNEISVDKVMLHKNVIRDDGAAAVGQLIINSARPVQEVHLSHNSICNRGICAIMDSVRRAGRYPYDTEQWLGSKSGKRQPWSPLWLRVENNTFESRVLDFYLNKHLHWCSALSRDRWQVHDSPPMVCLHKSYKQQRPPDTKNPVSWKGWGEQSASKDDIPVEWSEDTCELGDPNLETSPLNGIGRTRPDENKEPAVSIPVSASNASEKINTGVPSAAVPSAAHLREMATLVSSSAWKQKQPAATDTVPFDLQPSKEIPKSTNTNDFLQSEASDKPPCPLSAPPGIFVPFNGPKYDTSLGKYFPGEKFDANTIEEQQEVPNPYQTWLYGMRESSIDVPPGLAANPQESVTVLSPCSDSPTDAFFDKKKKGSNKIK